MSSEYQINHRDKNYLLKHDPETNKGIIYDGEDQILVLDWEQCEKKAGLLKRLMGQKKKIDHDNIAYSLDMHDPKPTIFAQIDAYKPTVLSFEVLLFAILTIMYMFLILLFVTTQLIAPIDLIVSLIFLVINIYLVVTYFINDNVSTDFFTPKLNAHRNLAVKAEVFAFAPNQNSKVMTANDVQVCINPIHDHEIRLDDENYTIGTMNCGDGELNVFVKQGDYHISIGKVKTTDASDEKYAQLMKSFLAKHETIIIDHIDESGYHDKYVVKLMRETDSIGVYLYDNNKDVKVGAIDHSEIKSFNKNQNAVIAQFIQNHNAADGYQNVQ